MLLAAHEGDAESPGAGVTPARKNRERTCAGCRESAPAEELLRLSHVPDHEPELVPDLRGRLGGRGVWVHPERGCVVKAAGRGGLARSLRKSVRIDADLLCEALIGQLEARIAGLVSAAARKRAAAIGTDAVRLALTTGAVRLLVVANDAAGRRDELCALAKGRDCPVTGLFDKASLGRLAGRETLGIMAISDAGIAKEIGSCARQLAALRRVNE